DDRAEEAWEPLFSIAELAGESWPERVRRAAVALSVGADVDDDELGVRLLADCRAVFASIGDRISTVDLIDALALSDEAPWADWHGEKVKPRTVSRLLRPFSI